MLNKLYEDNALGTIPQDRYEQMSQKYSEEYYALKAEPAEFADIVEIYPDVLNGLFCPFLVALMHFNPADKLVENGGGQVGKGSVAFRQLQKLLRPSARVLKSG